MALLLIDGCEDTSSFSQSGTTIVPARYQNGIHLVGTNQFVFRPLAAAESDTMTIGFALRRTVTAGTLCNVLTLLSDTGGTTHNRIQIETSGALSVTRSSTAIVTTATDLIAPNTWYYVELQIKLHDTTGSVTLRLDGAVVGTFTGDTKNAGTKTTYDTVQFISSSTHALDYDDIYVMAGAGDSFLGSITVETLYPDGNGAANEWLGSDGDSTDNYQLVDEVPHSISDYVSTPTVGDQDLYTLGALAHTTGTIVAVDHSAYMIRTDTVTPINVKLVNRGATDTLSAALPLGTSYRSYDYVLTTNPETGAAWTIAEINALQTGVELA